VDLLANDRKRSLEHEPASYWANAKFSRIKINCNLFKKSS